MSDTEQPENRPQDEPKGMEAEQEATTPAAAATPGVNDNELSDLDEDEVVSKPNEEDKSQSEQQDSGDDGEDGLPRRRRGDQGPRGHDDDEPMEQEQDPATKHRQELERKMDEALKTTRKKKRIGEDDLEQMQDEKMSQLREKMYNAAQADADSIRHGTSATQKLKLLPEVKAVFQKHNLADSILDNNMLEVMRMWLEPLPDASLPAFAIQKEMFMAAERLPIKSIHLRESGLGKVVLFYQKSKRPQLEIKRLADKLIGNWTRPIMGRSDNYRDKFVATKDYDPSVYSTSTSSNSVNLPQRKGGASIQEEAAMRRNRAHIPTARAVQYDVAPRNVVVANQGKSNDDAFKSIKQRMMQRNMKGAGSRKKR